MSVQGISSTTFLFLRPPEAVTSVRRATSTIAGVLDQINLDNKSQSADTISLRFSTLDRAHSHLRKTSSVLETAQARKTIATTVTDSLNRITHELTEIESLLTDIGEGDYSDSQLADAQLIIESRIARIDDISAGTEFSDTRVLTGETVRIETHPATGDGFHVYYPEIDSESLGLDSIDIVNTPADASLEIVSNARQILSSALEITASEIGYLDTLLTQKIENLESAFRSLKSSELLSAPPETRWLSSDRTGLPGGGNLGKLIPAAKLVTVLSGLNLDPDVVSSLLA